MKMKLLCAAATVALSALGCSAAVAAPPSAEAPIDLTNPTRYGTWGFDTAGMDRSVKPGDNFFEYADGAAVKAMVIPPDRTSYGAFVKLIDLSEARVHAILDEAAAQAAPQPATSAEKIGAFYKAFMDEAQAERLGAQPLRPNLQRVQAVRTREQMASLMGQANDGFFSSVVDVGIQPDEKDPDRYSVHLSQSGLGMPDRDYYLKPTFAQKKAAYQAYVAKLLQLAGWNDPAGAAAAVVAFETRIAEASWAREDERDPEKTYNPTTVPNLARTAPGLDWRTLLGAADLGAVQQVVVSESTALPKIAAIYNQTPLETLKAWQAFHLANAAAPYLSSAFVDARFDFFGRTLNGQPQLQARWKRGVNVVTAGMGEAIGQVYVAKYFPPSSKAKMEALVADLKAAFRARLEKLDWMSPQTKTEALKKLASFTVRIGYPDKWRDYSTLEIRSDDLAGDVQRAQRFEWLRQVRRLDKPVDKAEWDMTPQEVNAYNNPVFNEVVFPAAILQPPFFDPDADPAVNFGGIGGVIGHEMTHGFDDEGRKFDAEGRLRDWWTAADAQGFEQRATRLGAQYDTYSPVAGMHVNGKLTMGENIADSGGLNLALDAYHASLDGKPGPVLGGFTGDQRVFLAWAQVWRGKNRDDNARQRLVTDPHSPPEFRVNGVVRNVDGWYSAFDVQPGQALYLAPQDRAHIW
jgi:putative endopeptidase